MKLSSQNSHLGGGMWAGSLACSLGNRCLASAFLAVLHLKVYERAGLRSGGQNVPDRYGQTICQGEMFLKVFSTLFYTESKI